MLDPIAGHLAARQTRDLAHSALPHAPVREEPAPVPTRSLRRLAAVALRRLADRLEPIPSLPAGAR
jgi:hypothetical protein